MFTPPLGGRVTHPSLQRLEVWMAPSHRYCRPGVLAEWHDECFCNHDLGDSNRLFEEKFWPLKLLLNSETANEALSNPEEHTPSRTLRQRKDKAAPREAAPRRKVSEPWHP